MRNKTGLFEKFPKNRVGLPPEYTKIYLQHYKKNREGKTAASSLAKKMETWMHRKVAKDLKGNQSRATLEIGAGTLNQLEYENTFPYDIVEPFAELYQDSPYIHKVRNIYNDIFEVVAETRYDRITSIATFEHIINLPYVVAYTCLLLSSKGRLRVAIPNEGTLLWKMGWMITAGIEFRLRHKLNYGLLMRYEHVNTAQEIEHVLRHFYIDIKSSSFGIHKKMAFYRFFDCGSPDLRMANLFLK